MNKTISKIISLIVILGIILAQTTVFANNVGQDPNNYITMPMSIKTNKAETITINNIQNYRLAYQLVETPTENYKKYVAFIDSDDAVSSKYLTEMSKLLSSEKVSLSVSGFLYKRIHQKTEKEMFTNVLPERGETEDFKSYILKNLASDGRLYAAVNKIFRLEIIKKYKIQFPTGWNFAEDTNFVLRYLEGGFSEGFTEIKFLSKPYYIYHYGTETSTVAGSSLPWQNWQKSFNYLKAWVGKNPTKEQKYWLMRVLVRWRISHALAVARSNQKITEKWKYLNPVFLPLASLAAKIRK